MGGRIPSDIQGARTSIMKNVLLILLWLPMIVLGHVLSALIFRQGSLVSYVFFIAWPIANFWAAYKLCRKGNDILVIRLVSFFMVELAALVVLLTYAA